MHRRIAAIVLSAAAAIPLATTLPGALSARRAAREVALEARVLDADIAFLESRIAHDSGNWLIADHLAGLYAERFRSAADFDDVERAERLVRAALPLRLDPFAGQARLSSLLLAQHRFAEAYDAALRAVAVPHPRDAALAVLADAARTIGEDEVADWAIERLAPGTFARAVRSASLGSREDARQRTRRACMRLEERGASRDLRAWCVTRLAGLERDPDAKARRLREALSIQPYHRGAIEAVADMAYAAGDWDRARGLYARIAGDAHPDLWLRLAETSRLLGDERGADRHLGQFTLLASDSSREALFGLELAIQLARAGRCAEAKSLGAAELGRRRSVEAIEGVAWVSYTCGDTEHARSLLASAGTRLTGTGRYLGDLLDRRDGRVDESALAPYALYHHFTAGQR